MTGPDAPAPASVEEAQIIFARWLDAGTKLGLALLVAGFVAYVFGLVPPHLPLEALSRYWGLPLPQFLEAARAPTGWGWLALSMRGDYLNMIGIALLASIVALSYLRILPLLAVRERAFALIAALEIVVLLAAASGLLSGAH